MSVKSSVASSCCRKGCELMQSRLVSCDVKNSPWLDFSAALLRPAFIFVMSLNSIFIVSFAEFMKFHYTPCSSKLGPFSPLLASDFNLTAFLTKQRHTLGLRQHRLQLGIALVGPRRVPRSRKRIPDRRDWKRGELWKCARAALSSVEGTRALRLGPLMCAHGCYHGEFPP